ncbi:unnamed protein product [Trichobilharzia regenti]|nr:unnamed protein product [Trichobilharzia regenti]
MPESRQALKEVSVNHKLGDTFDMGGDYNTFAASANNNSSNASFSESQYEYKETSMMNSSHTSNNNNNDDVELMKQNLREEISRLRSEADILK